MVDSVEPPRITAINRSRPVTKNKVDKSGKKQRQQQQQKEKSGDKDRRIGVNIDEVC